ncbi:MAG: phage tail protein [Rhodothermales bacterium]
MTTHSRIRSLLSVWIGLFLLTVVFAPTVFAQKPPLKFQVKFEQLPRVTLEVVDGFEWATATDMAMEGREAGVGRTTYPTLTLQHTADGSNAVWNWYKNSGMMGKIDNRPGTIELVDGGGTVVRSYSLPLMIPSRYRLINGPDGVVEELEVVTVNPTMEIK